MTCCGTLKPFASLLTMAIKEGKTFRAYSDHYLELYNEIKGDNRETIASTFKVRIPIDSNLRNSLVLKPVTDMNKLMEQVEEYKRFKDD